MKSERKIHPDGSISIANKEFGFGLCIQVEANLADYQHSFMIATTFLNTHTRRPSPARIIEYGLN